MSEEAQAALDESQAIDSEAIEATQETEQQSTVEAATATAEEGQDGGYIPPEVTPDGVQARINKLTAEKFAEKREREKLQQRIDELEKRNNPTAAASPAGKPTLEQFDYDQDAYNEAMIDWKVEQKAQAIQQQQQQVISEQQAQERESKFHKRMTDYAAKNTDYFDSIANLPEFPAQTFDVIMGAENGPQLAHYLGKHLDVAAEVASLDPYSAAMRLGAISAQLSAPKQTVKQPSAAPEPIDPVQTGGSKAVNESPFIKGATFE